eukprot:12886638-Prorocentrum_lima.AAC.1
MMIDTFAEPPHISKTSSQIISVLLLKQDCMNKHMFSYCVVSPTSYGLKPSQADPFSQQCGLSSAPS